MLPTCAAYFAATSPVSKSLARRWRLRLPVLWLFRCFLPAWLRLSLPLAVTRKRFREALCDFCFGMGRIHRLSLNEKNRFEHPPGARKGVSIVGNSTRPGRGESRNTRRG